MNKVLVDSARPASVADQFIEWSEACLELTDSELLRECADILAIQPVNISGRIGRDRYEVAAGAGVTLFQEELRGLSRSELLFLMAELSEWAARGAARNKDFGKGGFDK